MMTRNRIFLLLLMQIFHGTESIEVRKSTSSKGITYNAEVSGYKSSLPVQDSTLEFQSDEIQQNTNNKVGFSGVNTERSIYNAANSKILNSQSYVGGSRFVSNTKKQSSKLESGRVDSNSRLWSSTLKGSNIKDRLYASIANRSASVSDRKGFETMGVLYKATGSLDSKSSQFATAGKLIQKKNKGGGSNIDGYDTRYKYSDSKASSTGVKDSILNSEASAAAMNFEDYHPKYGSASESALSSNKVGSYSKYGDTGSDALSTASKKQVFHTKKDYSKFDKVAANSKFGILDLRNGHSNSNTIKTEDIHPKYGYSASAPSRTKAHSPKYDYTDFGTASSSSKTGVVESKFGHSNMALAAPSKTEVHHPKYGHSVSESVASDSIVGMFNTNLGHSGSESAGASIREETYQPKNRYSSTASSSKTTASDSRYGFSKAGASAASLNKEVHHSKYGYSASDSRVGIFNTNFAHSGSESSGGAIRKEIHQPKYGYSSAASSSKTTAFDSRYGNSNAVASAASSNTEAHHPNYSYSASESAASASRVGGFNLNSGHYGTEALEVASKKEAYHPKYGYSAFETAASNAKTGLYDSKLGHSNIEASATSSKTEVNHPEYGYLTSELAASGSKVADFNPHSGHSNSEAVAVASNIENYHPKYGYSSSKSGVSSSKSGNFHSDYFRPNIDTSATSVSKDGYINSKYGFSVSKDISGSNIQSIDSKYGDLGQEIPRYPDYATADLDLGGNSKYGYASSQASGVVTGNKVDDLNYRYIPSDSYDSTTLASNHRDGYSDSLYNSDYNTANSNLRYGYYDSYRPFELEGAAHSSRTEGSVDKERRTMQKLASNYVLSSKASAPMRTSVTGSKSSSKVSYNAEGYGHTKLSVAHEGK